MTDHAGEAEVRAAKDHAREDARAGLALARQGRLADAERMLRQALEKAPGDASVTMGLARVLLGQNRPVDALELVTQCLAAAPSQAPDLLLLRAQILLSMKRLNDAITAFNDAIQAAPDDGTPELGLAIALGESGQPAGTAKAAQRAIGKGLDNAGVRYVLGRSLLECNRFDESEAAFRHALNFRPNDVESHLALAELVWMRTSDVTLATRELDACLSAHPGMHPLRIKKAKLLEASGNAEGALADMEHALLGPENDVSLRLAAAQMALPVDPERALGHAERAMRVAPRQLPVIAIYGDALFASGRVSDAQNAARLGLQIAPDNNHSIALLGSAWRVLGDPGYHALFDYTKVVRACPLDIPDGWSSLSGYLDDLARSLHRLHQLDAHPLHQTVRLGTQVNIAVQTSDDPVLRAFEQAIDGPIRRYMAAIGGGGGGCAAPQKHHELRAQRVVVRTNETRRASREPFSWRWLAVISVLYRLARCVGREKW